MKATIGFSVLIASVAGYTIYTLMNKATEALNTALSITF